jgi:glycosyltransferase involved in cell wall biosynthesis
MATGLPVVSTTTAAVPEMVDEHVGRLVPPDNPEALADAVEDMARLERESRLDLGRAARKRVEERFNLYDESSKLLALFDGVARDYFGTPVTPARR